jgi:hypothetical protein
LVVHDYGDAEVEHTNGAAIAKAWPRAQLYSTSGLGHRRLLRDSAVIQTVVDFIAA